LKKEAKNAEGTEKSVAKKSMFFQKSLDNTATA